MKHTYVGEIYEKVLDLVAKDTFLIVEHLN